MLTALVRLRSALQHAVLPLELPERRRAPGGPQRDGRPARGLRHPARDDARRAAARGRRRLDRRRQVDAGQLAGRHPRHRARRAPPDHAVAGAGAQPRRRGLVRPGPAPARPRAGAPVDQRPGRAPAGAQRTACPRGWRSSTPPTSTPSRSPTARSRRSCWPRPTSGSSSPRRPGTPTRCRGTSCARPRTGRRPSRSSSTAPRPTPSTPSPPTWRGCSPRAGSRTHRSSPSSRASVDENGLLPAEAVAEISGWLVDLAADAEARGGRRQADPGRRDPHPHPAYARGRRRRGRAGRRRGAAARGRQPRLRPRGRRHRRRDGRRHAAARRGAGAVAGVRRHGRAAARPRDQGRLAARPASSTRSRASRSRPSGSRSPSSPGWRR